MASPEDKKIGQNIRRALRQKGYSQKKISSITNLAESTISDYINAKTSIPAKFICDIASICDVSIEELFSGATEGTPTYQRQGVSSVYAGARILRSLRVILNSFGDNLNVFPVTTKQVVFEKDRFEEKEVEQLAILIKDPICQGLIRKWEELQKVLSELSEETYMDTNEQLREALFDQPLEYACKQNYLPRYGRLIPDGAKVAFLYPAEKKGTINFDEVVEVGEFRKPFFLESYTSNGEEIGKNNRASYGFLPFSYWNLEDVDNDKENLEKTLLDDDFWEDMSLKRWY